MSAISQAIPAPSEPSPPANTPSYPPICRASYPGSNAIPPA